MVRRAVVDPRLSGHLATNFYPDRVTIERLTEEISPSGDTSQVATTHLFEHVNLECAVIPAGALERRLLPDTLRETTRICHLTRYRPLITSFMGARIGEDLHNILGVEHDSLSQSTTLYLRLVAS